MDAPGLVDLQVNGYRGVDFSGAGLRREHFVRACRAVLAAGTSAFLPTMITSPEAVYERNLGIMAAVMDDGEFRGRLPGIHLEGPFISPAAGARGAHDPDLVRAPDPERFEQYNRWAGGKIRMLTLAAELPGAAELAAHAAGRGVAVALGHQEAGAAAIARLREAGAAAITHLGNGVAQMLDRHDNPVWAGLADDGLSATIITDGHHLPDDLVRIFVRVKGPGRLIVVSDAAPVAGLPPGRYRTLGNDVVLAEDGRLHIPDTGYLAGSSATMLACINRLCALQLLSTEELIAVGFSNPLRLIGVDPASIDARVPVRFDEERNRFYTGETR